MIIGEPLGLLALLGIPAVVAIHLFRRRFRPRPVTALWLYGPVPETPAAGRRRSRLSNRRSLWLELLACLALAWWLSDPHLDDRAEAEHLVVVLDARWRMQARADDGTSVRERASQALAAILDGLDRDDRVSLVGSGEPPQLLAGPEVPPRRARAALDRWTCQAPYHQLDDALRLGRELLAQGDGAGGRSGRLLVVSDREPAQLPPGTGLLLRGRPQPNDALIEARWLRADAYGGERLVLRVLAVGGGERRRELVLADGERELARRPLQLRPGQVTALSWPVRGLATGELLRVALAGNDALAVDDELRLRRPLARVLRVHLDPEVPGRDWWQRALDAQVEAELVDDPAQAQLLVQGPDAPSDDDGTWRVVVAGADDGPPVLGPYLARTGHPLLRDLDATGAVWAGGATILDPGAVLLAAGDRALVTERRHGRGRVLRLHLDPQRSTIGEHPVWPALVANLVAMARAALPGLEQPNQPLGVALAVVLPPEAERLAVIDPTGERAELSADGAGRVVVPPLQHAGTHALRLDAAEDDWLLLEAVPGDPRLADTAGAQWLDRAPEAGGEAEVARRRGPVAHILPLLAAAAAAAGAWWCFAREEGAGGRRETSA